MTDVVRKGKPFEDESITSLITKGLESNERLRRKNLYASDAAYCPRKSSIIVNIPEEYKVITSSSGKLYMAIGSAVHEKIQLGLRNAGALIASEFRIDGLGISLGGYIDAIIRLNDEPRVLEIKTCGNLPSKPKPEHVSQALTYSLVTGIPKPIMYYVSRSVAGWDGKLITRTFELEPSRQEYFVVAQNLYPPQYYSQAQRLAEIPAHIRTAANCGFCPFKNMCWGGGEPFQIDLPSYRERLDIEERARADAEALVAGFGLERMAETMSKLASLNGGAA
jgi:CRISPR/Cas system-associated exonuclease Cas4 (RecB family)